jgi:hypothetical protein
LFAAKLVSRYAIAKPTAKWFVPAEKGELEVEKCEQAILSILEHTAFTVWGYLVLSGAVWVWPSDRWWQDRSAADGSLLHARNALSGPEQFFYLAYGARYAVQFFCHFLEEAKSDFWAMLAHHLITTVLVLVSYSYNFVRVGLVIMNLLDSSDIFLQCAKLGRYASMKKNDMYDHFTTVSFVIFLLNWLALKVYAYFYVVWSCYAESAMHFSHGIPEKTCKYGLTILGGIILLWTYKIMQVVQGIVTGKGVQDSRSPPKQGVVPKAKDAKPKEQQAAWPKFVREAARFMRCLVQASNEHARPKED